jgi:hypothetical protein
MIVATQPDDGRIRRRYGSILARRPLPISHRDPKQQDTTPGFGARIVHLWRYGMYHPDEDLLGVIDAAVDSLTTQIKAAEGILTGPRLASLHALRKELNVELQDEVPELSVLLGIEAKINALYPPSVQRRRAWMVEERFRRVASGHAADYWATDRTEKRVSEQHGARLDQADHDVAAAEAAEASASAALERAAAELKAAEDAFAAALGGEPEAEVDPELDRLEALKKSDPGGAETAALDEKRGPLLPLRARARAARAAQPPAQAEKDAASWVLEQARLERALVEARYEVERVQARLRGTDRAAREAPGGGPAAGDATAAVDEELSAAQTGVNQAAAAVEAHEATRPANVPAPPPRGPGAAAGSGAAAPAGSSLPFDADAQSLLGYIHSAYLMGIARERAVRDLMRWLMMRFWTANLIFLLSLFAAWGILKLLTTDAYQYHALIGGLFVIAVIGRIGATMSVVQRLQKAVGTNVLANDPIQELTRLRTGKNGINVALFSGGVFALLMYILFASGIPAILGLDDGAAPAISTIQRQEQMELEQRLRSQNIAARAREASQQEDVVRDLERQVAGTQSPPSPTATTGTTAPPGSTGAQPQPAADPAVAAALQARLERERERLDDLRRTAVDLAATAHPDPGTAPAGEAQDTQQPATDDEAPAGNVVADAGNAAAGNGSVEVANAAAEQAAPEANAAGNVAGEPAGNATAAKGAAPAAAPAEGEKPNTQQSGPRPEQCMAKEPCDPFVLLADALGLADREDFFKLLIWAFLAGFAERLVPDALDAIARRGRRRQRTGGAGEETA